MIDVEAPLAAFAAYAASLSGDEKGEAQVFCDRLFQAFGHEGYKQAGATLEERVRTRSGGIRFADLVWKPRLLLEMKKRGEKLARHRDQACDYWRDLVPNRPRYVLLCNFDEVWIYDFDTQVDEPVDRVLIADLPRRYTALGFLFPDAVKPLFGNDRTAVTNEAAGRIGDVFRALVKRGENRERAQRFTLQCVVALFAEDIGLLPRALFTSIVADCRAGTASSYDLFGSLFRQMNSREAARGGRFRGVDYFNGGLFAQVEPVELTREDLELLERAANGDWSRINPAIFGSLFQSSMSVETRHQRGAHYTHEADIQRIVLPTLVRPLREELERATTLDQLRALRERLTGVRVLDPACGSGNFLYVAYRELMRLEIELLEKIHSELGPRARKAIGTSSLVNALQLFGLDIDPFAVELAKVTLSFGKKLALDEARDRLADVEGDLPLAFESPLPLDNLDANVRCDDALFCAWPQADVIIGNPPYQSKNKMQQELGAPYMRRLREKYPDVPGRADYCVYWFRRAHDELPPGGRAGLVGTNTIRQNYSRQGGLDYIVANGGTITEAVSTQVWPGEAVVHVSLVNWVKGVAGGKKKLFTQLGDRLDSPWRVDEVDRIPSSLSAGVDVTGAKPLRANSESGACYQGQTHGHEGFLLEPDEARRLREESASAEVILPYLIADALIGSVGGKPDRFVIDLNHCEDLLSASRYERALSVVRERVRDDIVQAAEAEKLALGKGTGPRQLHARRWWKHWRGRPELIARLATIPRYVACGQVTKRPIFEFVSSLIRPNAALIVFPLPDDYSFGILQSGFHGAWFSARCSTMKGDSRYTSNSVFDSFPWPQAPSPRAVEIVAEAGRTLRAGRRRYMVEHGLSLRELYASLEEPGEHPLRRLHEKLDVAVRDAYGARKVVDPLAFLLELDLFLAGREERDEFVAGPGLPPGMPDPSRFVSDDAVTEATPTQDR